VALAFSDLADELAATSWPGTFRRQQTEALDALESVWAGEQTRAWLALPPGAGKTLVGLEAARRLGRPTVIFGPNTAIQSQWIAQWSSFEPATTPAGSGRDLGTPITALTYQSLAVFDPDAEVDEEGHDTTQGGPPPTSRHIDRLHPNGLALVETLRTAGPITLILDEAHHLLEVWGALLAELLDVIPDAYVIGLTATPPQTLSADQAALVDRLFGHPIYQASVPGLVRDGYLAPFAELSWLTTPTPAERDWLAAQAERFTELRTDVMTPEFATVGLFDWLDRRFVDRSTEFGSPLSWARLERTKPELATAALRLHHAGLMGLPDGGRIREEHRREPTAADWVAVLDDYVRQFLRRSSDPVDVAALERIKQALPSIGYRLTRNGIRAGRSPMDRVLARSEAKTHGAIEIVAWEAGALGSRLRALVLCDHERATATLPARLRGVLDPQAGSARLLLENLVADPRTAEYAPVMVTGRTVAAAADTARAFVAWVGGEVELSPIPAEATGVVEIAGRWTSRTWVKLVTRFFEEGRCRVLVGTRALLGEGWNAPSVNTLIDLTTATTPTAVVQTRGRALRTDPDWPEKVATNWSVVCVSEDHPGGDADWGRFVRKHDGYLAADRTGEIVDGVAHVDDSFSPYKPPPAADFDALNAAMLERSIDHASTREAWQIGTPYADRFVHELRIRPGRMVRRVADATQPPDLVPAERGLAHGERLDGRRRRESASPATLADIDAPGWMYGFSIFGAIFLIGVPIAAATEAWVGWLSVPVSVALCFYLTSRYKRRLRARELGRLLTTTAEQPADLAVIAYAVADALKLTDDSPVGADAVRIDVDASGTYRAVLTGVDVEVTRTFVTALDEALSPIGSPRYVIPRYVLDPPDDPADAGRKWLTDEPEPNAAVYHAVPSVFGVNGRRAAAFERAWGRWVSSGSVLYTGSPEGAGILVAQRGADPMDSTTLLRIGWA
jgi:superfamily II DNA or RNA helicase